MARHTQASDIVDLTVEMHAETDRAILVSDDGDKNNAVWLPKSQIEIDERKGKTLEIQVPEWLAADKGLI